MLTIFSFVGSLIALVIVGLDMLIDDKILSVILTILVLSFLVLLVVVPMKFWINYRESQEVEDGTPEENIYV